MHGVDFMKAFKAVKNLFQEVYSFTLWKLTFLPAVILKVSSIAELSYNEDIISRTKRFYKLYDVFALDLLKDFDFGPH